MGGFFASGTYEVIWSLWMTELGADLGLVGLTFASFGLGVLLLSPDRRALVGPARPAPLHRARQPRRRGLAGILYALLEDPVLVVPVVFFEGISFALLGPALYAVVARGTPAGRSATTQGVYGAAGTLGTIVASIAAGVLFAIDIHLPVLHVRGRDARLARPGARDRRTARCASCGRCPAAGAPPRPIPGAAAARRNAT